MGARSITTRSPWTSFRQRTCSSFSVVLRCAWQLSHSQLLCPTNVLHLLREYHQHGRYQFCKVFWRKVMATVVTSLHFASYPGGWWYFNAGDKHQEHFACDT